MTKKDYVEQQGKNLNYTISNGGTASTGNDELDKFFKNYEECFNRLPCGICRLTNMPCPKITNYEPNKITWYINNHIEDPVDTKTTNHITSKEPKVNE